MDILHTRQKMKAADTAAFSIVTVFFEKVKWAISRAE